MVLYPKAQISLREWTLSVCVYILKCICYLLSAHSLQDSHWCHPEPQSHSPKSSCRCWWKPAEKPNREQRSKGISINYNANRKSSLLWPLMLHRLAWRWTKAWDACCGCSLCAKMFVWDSVISHGEAAFNINSFIVVMQSSTVTLCPLMSGCFVN